MTILTFVPWLTTRKVSLPVLDAPPRTECVSGPRPCPWETCRYHLAPTGRQRVNHTGTPRDERDSCALDVADRGEHTLQEVALLLELVPQRIKQIEADALYKLSRTAMGRELLEQLKNRP